jgi:osmotically inducible protein OsmC
MAVTPLYSTSATAGGGRQGDVVSDDGRLSVRLDPPVALGGSSNGTGSNPEQLFAAGYAACFLSALGLAARRSGFSLTADASVTARIGLVAQGGGAFALLAGIDANLPGLDPDTGRGLLATAHGICPYSNALRGNVDVELSLNGAFLQAETP